MYKFVKFYVFYSIFYILIKKKLKDIDSNSIYFIRVYEK